MASLGWSGWKCNGASAGNGSNQIEAIAISGFGNFQRQVHMQGVGWTIPGTTGAGGWSAAGTTGQSRRLEALAIENFTTGRICGRANIQGIGWQALQHSVHTNGGPDDIIVLGTVGQSRAIYTFQLNAGC